MYDVIFAVKSRLLLEELIHMHIWGDSTGFQVRKITDDFGNLTAELKKAKYHLVFLEALSDNNAISLLHTIKKENLCQAIAVISETADFKTVRQCFLLGADDYFVIPMESSQFITLFSKIENVEHGKIAAEICEKEELIRLFEQADYSIKEQLDKMFYHTLSEVRDLKEAVGYLKRVFDGVIADLFERYEWLKYYFVPDFISSVNYDALEWEERAGRYLEIFYSFFEEFAELYPPHGEGLDEILLYILNRPQEDLRQKTISEKLYINRSYLSTVFAAQIGVNFVDYVNMVKMKRAAYLLKNTKMKVIDIAGALDYKDMGYFLKRFKARYGVTPSQYRIPENYEFQI